MPATRSAPLSRSPRASAPAAETVATVPAGEARRAPLGWSIAGAVLAGAIALVVPWFNPAAPAAAGACPLAGEEQIGALVGETVGLHPLYGVNVEPSNVECMFEGREEAVLVRRETGHFDATATPGLTFENAERLRRMFVDEPDYLPVAGIGDGALWATVRDRSLADERMAILIVRQGNDAVVVGVWDTPDALPKATAVTQVVLAGAGG